MIFSNEINYILKRKLLAPVNLNLIEDNTRAILTHYLSKSKETFALFAKQPVNKKEPTITLCLTDSYSLEAFVTSLRHQDHFLVGLSYGLFADIYACFSALLSHPEILPHVGNPSDTHCKFDFCEHGLLDFTFEHDIIKEHTPFERGFPLYNYPKDFDRILYATLLSDIAIQFILYHEWGHISGGHLDYMNHLHKLGEIAEINPTLHATTKILGMIGNEPIRRSMEFEADYIAASMISTIPLNLAIHNRTLFQAYPADFIAKYDARSAVFFSIMALFHLFEEIRIKNNSEPSKIYPSPYFRFCSLVFGISGNSEREPDPYWTDFDHQGVKDFTSASLILGFNFKFADEVYDEEATRKEIIKLDDNLIELRRHLQEYRLSK